MATVHVWPGLKPDGTSLTVLAEDGVTPIPAEGGAIVPYVKYYSDLMATSELLDYDPLGLSGDAITIPPITRISSGLVGLLTTQLSSRTGLSDSEFVETVGRAAASDGGGGSWRFALGVSSGADGREKVNGPNGQWQRTESPLTLRGAGCTLDGTADDAPALSDILNDAGAVGGATLDQVPARSIVVGATQCAIYSTVTVSGNPLQGNLRLRGNGGRNVLANGIHYVWMGAPGGIMFDIRAYGLVWENARLTYAPGHAPLTMVNFGPGSSVCTLANMYFKSVAGLEPATYGITTDVQAVAPGNCENMNIDNCWFEDFGTYGIDISLGHAQPFNWLLTRPVFLQYGWPAYYLAQSGTQKLRGAGIHARGGYSFRMIGHDANACESVVRGNGSFTMIGGSSERCKQLYDGANATGESLNQLVMNTRFGVEDMALESVGPRGVAAGIKHLITKQERGTFKMSASDITGGPDTDVKIVILNGAGYVGHNNNYVNTQPFSGDGGTFDPSTVWAGLFSVSESGMSGAGPVYSALPQRTTGSWQPPFTFTLANGDGTSKVIAFSSSALYQPNLRYRVKLTPIDYTGAPSAGSLSWRISAIAASGFTVTFEAATGIGATRTFHCEMEPY